MTWMSDPGTADSNLLQNYCTHLFAILCVAFCLYCSFKEYNFAFYFF